MNRPLKKPGLVRMNSAKRLADTPREPLPFVGGHRNPRAPLGFYRGHMLHRHKECVIIEGFRFEKGG